MSDGEPRSDPASDAARPEAADPAASGPGWFHVPGKAALFLAAALFVATADRFGKFFATETLSPGAVRPVLGDWFGWAHVETPRAALGLLDTVSSDVSRWIFGALSLACVMLVLTFYRGLARGEWASAAALGAILAGVVSNAFDRFERGAALDGLYVGPAVAPLATLNVADVAIVLGAVTLMGELLVHEMAGRVDERRRR